MTVPHLNFLTTSDKEFKTILSVENKQNELQGIDVDTFLVVALN